VKGTERNSKQFVDQYGDALLGPMVAGETVEPGSLGEILLEDCSLLASQPGRTAGNFPCGKTTLTFLAIPPSPPIDGISPHPQELRNLGRGFPRFHEFDSA
jgi:hypothetical protein